jgi:hypothetical protein
MMQFVVIPKLYHLPLRHVKVRFEFDMQLSHMRPMRLPRKRRLPRGACGQESEAFEFTPLGA